jgi:hypothetical protein
LIRGSDLSSLLWVKRWALGAYLVAAIHYQYANTANRPPLRVRVGETVTRSDDGSGGLDPSIVGSC